MAGDYNIGDTKEVDLGELGKHTIRVANTSTPSECFNEGFSQTACGFVLEFVNAINKKQMNSTDTNKGGWPGSELYTYVTNDLYNLFPSDLKNIIIDTIVVSGYGKNDSNNFISTDKLYLLATAEVWAQGSSNTIDYDTARDVTRQLDYYKKKGVTTNRYSSAIKKLGTVDVSWWLRSTFSNGDYNFYESNIIGNRGSGIATYAYGISPAFRIG